MTPDERIEEARRLRSVALDLSYNQLASPPDRSRPLRGIEGMTDFGSDRRRKGSHVLTGRRDPPDRLEPRAFHLYHYTFSVYLSRIGPSDNHISKMPSMG